MKIITLDKVCEKYRIKFIREGKISWEEINALEDISFTADEGEVLGIIGQNGAGKSTLLKLIAGMLVPDEGTVCAEGRVSVLMELGAGFNPEFTGRENIKLNARIYGLDEERLNHQMGRIIEFAEIGKFIDAPIKYYSQGMYMRLAFALAIFVEPDILLIDDILSVGDEEAQRKSKKKIFELKESGKTIILVSHDMSMISRLCNRVILLDKGKIIAQGLTEEVMPYYLETVGDKKGIATLEKEKLRVVFNNGKVLLSYDGRPLTTELGGYVCFFDLLTKSIFPSSNLSWGIKNITPDAMVAEGRRLDGEVSQIWMFELWEDGLWWQTEVTEKNIKQPFIDFVFRADYKEWMSLIKDGKFPPFAFKSKWHNVGVNSCSDGIVGISADGETSAFPSLILEKKDKNDHIELLNTGYEQEGRAIHIPLNENKSALSIRILTDRKRFRDYFLDCKQQQQQEQPRFRCAFASGNLRLYADQEHKTIRLYYQDTELTKGSGIHSAFYIARRWITLKDAQWQVQNTSGEKLILFFDYDQLLPLREIWEFTCSESNILKLNIDVETFKPVFIFYHYVGLELKDVYRRWKTAYEQGGFSVNQYMNDVRPIRLKDQKISKILLFPDEGKNTPILFFDSESNSYMRNLSLFKRQAADEQSLCLNSTAIIPKDKSLIKPGKHPYFSGRIILNKEVKLEENISSGAKIELGMESLRFVFDCGKGKILWGEKELTAGLCVYTSVRSSGIWLDSYQAVWQVKEKEKDRIVVSGDWPHISISQKWQIELRKKNRIFWQVDMEVYEETDLEIEQSNIMLSPEYKRWSVSERSQGEFPEEYTDNYDILPFRFWYGKVDYLQAESGVLPKIIFKAEARSDNLWAIVENTDSLYQARLLQYQMSRSRKLMPAIYPYFRGVIEIGN